MSKNHKPIEIDLFSPLGLIIGITITIPLFAIFIVPTYFPKTWEEVKLKLRLENATWVVQHDQRNTKTVEFKALISTPAGELPITKYSNDRCLYAQATVAQTNYYGIKQLKDHIKKRFQVECVFWE
ncbi:hypothetical protein [Nostoc sp. UHCC 0870]|uniref:hypothetical protein n=1 Tax=Nostoc sp. UHCC 0870 TaxID=2914041 RepID=UPI001EE0E03E|nr:hypothetical protein [Nostoc sp. UHCC 0870]UKP01577.1 hypothetical protein L6494_30590 [Nostoc sp. UHCC 0870]